MKNFEDGNPIEDEDAPKSSPSAATVDPADVDYGDSATGDLRQARNTFTGTSPTGRRWRP